MTKSEFVDQVAYKADLNKKEAGEAVDAALQIIEEALSRGAEITFSGFGKFHVADRSARQGVGPRTGARGTRSTPRRPASRASPRARASRRPSSPDGRPLMSQRPAGPHFAD